MDVGQLIELTISEVSDALVGGSHHDHKKLKNVEYDESQENDDMSDENSPLDCLTELKTTITYMVTIPSQVHKMILYNMMVDANRLIDDPYTTFFERLPCMLNHMGNLVGLELFMPEHSDTLLWTIPKYESDVANNPTLQIVQYNKDKKVVRRWEISVSLRPEPIKKVFPALLSYGGTVSHENIHVTPHEAPGSHGHLLPSENVSLSTFCKWYGSSMQGYVPQISVGQKRQVEEFERLTPCDMAARIVKKQAIEVSVSPA